MLPECSPSDSRCRKTSSALAAIGLAVLDRKLLGRALLVESLNPQAELLLSIVPAVDVLAKSR